MSVAVITPAIPGRLHMLAECMASVRAQTHPVAEHLVAIDYAGLGVVENFNRAVAAARADWIIPLADDDVLETTFVERLVEAAGNDADVVYSFCRVESRDPVLAQQFVETLGINREPFDPVALRERNYVPSTALIHRELWLDLGGYRSSESGLEDWDFWVRALDAGAVFRLVPDALWVYRWGHGEGNASLKEAT